jgi:hypothetical protein
MGNEARTTRGRAAQEASGRAARGGGGWRLGTSPTGGPHLSARGRERGEEAGAGGPLGRKWELGRGWKKNEGGEVGRGVGLAVSLSLFFFFFFKSISNQFQTLLNSNLLHLFKFKF